MSGTLYYAEQGVEVHCGRVEDVLATIDPRTVALLLADPPYGVNEQTKRASKGRGRTAHGSLQGSSAKRSNDFAAVEGDDRPFDPSQLITFPRAVLWGANHYANRLPASPSWIFWDKRAGTTSDDNADGEMAWTNIGGPARMFSHLWRGLCRASENNTRREHPTQKPVALGAWVLQRAKVKAGDLVVVPYAGSGPDVIACRNAGVRVIAIECVEAYCEVIKQRLVKAPIFPMLAPPPIVKEEQGPSLFDRMVTP